MKSILKFSLLTILLFTFSCEIEQVDENSLNNILKATDVKGDDDSCETAFGYFKENCFLNYDFNRWGWTIGPLKDSSFNTYDIYSGAGKCNIGKGTLVGTLSVSYVDGTVSVSYDMFEGYGLTETHLYVGNDMFPQKPNGQYTVAPGQYGNQNSFDIPVGSDSYDLDGIEGDIYVIAHAVVCEVEVPEECKVQAGPLKAEDKVCLDENGQVTIYAVSDESSVVPEGYEILYVLTSGSELIIVDVSAEPSFTIQDQEGDFRIHILVYDPLTLDLSGVVFGETTGFDIYELTQDGGGKICASIDTKGVLIEVMKCDTPN